MSGLNSSKLQKFLVIITLIVTVLLCYGKTLPYPFIWDDEEMVVGNPLIRSVQTGFQSFTTGAFLEKLESGKFYRPIQLLSYSIDYHFWELNPTGFRATNIALHTLSSILLFLILLQLGSTLLISGLLSVLWAVHPVHIEAITYISGRGDALFMCFSLLAFYLYLQLNESRVYLLLPIAGAWILAILSKENAISLPLLLILHTVFFLPKTQKRLKTITASSMGILWLGYLIIRFGLMPGSESGTLSAIASASLWERILTLPYILFSYCRLWIFPYPLHMDYHYVAHTFANVYLLVGLPFLVCLLTALYFWLPNKKRTVFWILWFGLSLGPVYQIPIALASTIREHWMYLPSVAIIGLMAETLTYLFQEKSLKWPKLQPLGLSVLGFFIVTMACVTWNRNSDWETGYTLYAHDVEFEPNSFILHNNLGVEYFRMGLFELAKSSFLSSIETAPGKKYGTAFNNYGVILEQEGHLQAALNAYKSSIELSQYQLAYGNLGRLLCKNQRFTEAIPILEAGIQANPYYPETYFYLGIAYIVTHQTQKGVEILKKLNTLQPGNAQVEALIHKYETSSL